MISLLMGVLAAQAQPLPVRGPAAATPCSQVLCGAEALAPFFARLRDAGDRPVHILQIGDSHTAADAVSNALRSELQHRFGNAGRGMMAPGRPYPRVVTWNVTAAQSEGWTTTGLLDAERLDPIGMTGFAQSTRLAGSTLTLTADDDDQLFTAFRVCAITGPGAGAVRLSVGARSVDWSLDGPAGVQCRSVDSPAPAQAASLLTLTDRPVTIASVATLRSGGGVLLSNLGVIGAQIAHLARADDRVAAAELAAFPPDLIIVAFGTNEVYREELSAQDYEQGLEEQLARLRRLAGAGAPILLIGPPDVGRRRAADPELSCGEDISTPRHLAMVRETQRRVARAQGLAFWDWERAMGGRCSHLRWLADSLMRDDLVHFNRDGGDRIGRMLFADLARVGIAADPRWGGPTGTLPPRAEATTR